MQGTGGVSIFAAQIAAAYGARVIATSSNDESLDKVKALDVRDGINYRTYPDWEKKVLELTDGEGVDVTIDVAGGASQAVSLHDRPMHRLQWKTASPARMHQAMPWPHREPSPMHLLWFRVSQADLSNCQ